MVTTARIGDPAWRTLKSQYDEKVSVVLATFDGRQLTRLVATPPIRLAAMSGRSVVRRFDEPDERNEFDEGFVDLVSIGGVTFGRETLTPHWRWSKHVRPIAGTERCEFHHVGYQLSGRWIVEDRDGFQLEIKPGDIFDTPPGHDAWIAGDEPCVTIDFQGIADWAVRGPSQRMVTTVLFTDIVDSTATIARIGDVAWRTLKSQYDEKVSVALATFDGVLVDTSGDGAFARFGSAAAALRAAQAIVAGAERVGLPTRAGIHTGEVELKENAVSGMTVHIGARVMALAGPGEVLVTSMTRDLTIDSGFAFEEKGTYELKGVSGGRTVYALAH
jgi:class 3 adenylate cyclase